MMFLKTLLHPNRVSGASNEGGRCSQKSEVIDVHYANPIMITPSRWFTSEYKHSVEPEGYKNLVP